MEDSMGARANGPVAAPRNPGDSSLGPPLSPDELEDEQQSSLTDVTQMWIKFGKTFAIIFPIYVLGYFEFSFSWVLVGLAALLYWRKNYGGQDYRINRALAFLEHRERVVKQVVPTTELPPWVHYPDVERVEWLNKTVRQMWPFICQFVDKLFRDTIEPAVKGANPHLGSFCFTKIDMGDKLQTLIRLSCSFPLSFVGNTEIDVDIKKYYCRAGIKSIQLHGVMRVVMEPLLGDMPLVGALSIFFLKKPLLDINWSGLTNMLDIPGVNGLCDNMLQDIIYSYLVLPNRITIPLVGEAQLAQLRFPVPKGVLRIHFIEAQELLGKDKFLGGLIKGKSDPYGVIQVGTELFQSRVIHETVHPKWNEVFEALVYDHSGQNLSIELFDEDTDKDDFLGCLTVDLAELQKEHKVDEWFTMEDVATGKLHLKLEWLSLMKTPERLDQVLSSIKADRGHANDGLSSALLVVFLDSARNLPVFLLSVKLVFLLQSGKKVTSDPNPFVQFTVGHKSFESKTKYKTNEPVWEETYTFLIHNPRTQQLEVEVKDEKHECSLGTLTVPLQSLLEAEDMTLNQRFPLKNSGPSCTLKMKMALRVTRLHPSETRPRPRVRRHLLFKSGSPAPPATPAGPPPPPSPPGLPAPPPTAGQGLAEAGRSTSNLTISGSQTHLAGGKEPTPSIASDISNPYAAQELQQRLHQLHNGSGPSYYPLGEIQLTVRHSSQRNRLIVVVHACRNLIAFSDSGSDPYVRLYLLPDKRRSGRRKTHTFKKTLNPVYDQTFEFSVSLVELHRRTLDVAVKNGGGLLSKHKGLLGKVLFFIKPRSADLSLAVAPAKGGLRAARCLSE
uniref:Extended synaptotagmin-2-A-like n=1 Tax=Salarias fasciatus TaxID=181472 RepID=A0A672HMY7_SALFA